MSKERPVAAAVAYRDGVDGPEFLLVRTKGGRKWTFPKGHVKSGEEPWEAALREAAEEAGIDGEVDTVPVAEYDYPNTRRGRGDTRVPAYLLRVTDQQPPSEGFREPAWFSPERAREHLAEGGREPRYAEEHARVLESAVDELERRG